MSDLLISAGVVVNGTGEPSYRSDVRVRNGMIVEVAPDLERDGEEVIDASGCVVSPGFIDSHTHFDPSLWWDPQCDPMPQHGVTSVVIGNCSLSLAPVRPGDHDTISETFAFIEDFSISAFRDHVPWTWTTYRDYVARMQGHPTGVNVAGLVGHSMLRQFVLGDEAWERTSSPTELQLLAAELDDAMSAGAVGLSVSFFDTGPDGRPVPSSIAADDEFRALIGVVGRHGGHLELIPNITLDPAAGTMQLQKCGEWCREAGVVMSWNAFYDAKTDPSRADRDLATAASLRASGTIAYPQMSPRPIELRLDFGTSMAFRYLDAWNEFVNADATTKHGLISSPSWRSRAALEWDAAQQQLFPHREVERVRIASVSNAALEPWVGQSLEAWRRHHGGHPSDALADLLERNECELGLIYEIANGDPERVGKLCASADTLLSASDAGAHVRMFCAAGDTTLLLTRHVRDRRDLTLEAAIHKLTAQQAEMFHLGNRGRIAPGQHGDLVVFDLEQLTWGEEQIRRDFPGGAYRLRRPPGGYHATVVAGVTTQLDGESTGRLPGTWIGHQS